MRREAGQMTLALTPEQRRIVEWGDGPLVVIAGAGTGKTRVIVERVRYLLEHRDGTAAGEPARPDLQREGGARAPGAAGPGGRAGDAGPDDGHELPQLLPADPDRVGGRCRAAAAPGRARRRRAGAPAQGHPPEPAARLPLGLVALELRPVHQPGEGRARQARTTSMPSSPRSAASSRRDTAASRPPPAPRDPGQPPTLARRARRLRLASARTNAPRTAARRRTTTQTPPTRPPTAKPAEPSPAPVAPSTAGRSTPTTTRASTPWRRPTSSTAPPSRSCG